MFTVVIPTYNREDKLELNANRLNDQIYYPDEILIINNGDKPLSNKIKLENFKNVRVIETVVSAGVSQARNIGATVASNEWIAFLDDDDSWDERYLFEANKTISSNPEVISVLGKKVIYDEETKSRRDYKSPKGKLALEELFIKNPGIGGPNTIIRKKEFLGLGGYDITLKTSEDKSLIIDLIMKNGDNAVIVNEKMIALIHRDGGERLTDPKNMMIGINNFIKKYEMKMSRSQIYMNKYKIERYRMRVSDKFNPLLLMKVSLFKLISILSR
ncbi:glycosyltransferase family 2 protein [Alkalicoccus chagannorensis]|uniref:glycosyltransferase family 2 protein n=1 Tax=Alkalicoccus chagannorensis TaxID=427072 RepID=UPI00040A9C08|nr:glycosyltransferase family 2 protein [Alkalicoccus chagannorensis]